MLAKVRATYMGVFWGCYVCSEVCTTLAEPKLNLQPKHAHVLLYVRKPWCNWRASFQSCLE